jgi:hypothetical protein
MDMKKLKFCTVVLLVFIAYSSFGQTTEKKFFNPDDRKNTFYGTIAGGGAADAMFSTSWNYERFLTSDTLIKPFIKLTYGGSARLFREPTRYVCLQYGRLYGANRHHFEYTAGLSLHRINSGSSWSNTPSRIKTVLHPAVNIGYRAQRPHRRTIFRCGVGYPEIVYTSIGMHF